MKKGDIRISYVIGGVVAVFVLVAVIYFLANSGGNLSKYIDWIIPRKNETKGGVAGIEIFRYDIAGGNAGYYDGTKWMVFEEIIVGGKKINAESLKKDFENYYFGERKESIIPIGYLLSNFYQIIKDKSGKSLPQEAVDYLIEKSVGETGKKESELKVNAIIGGEDISSSGNVAINLADEEGKIINNAGYFNLRLDNTLEFHYTYFFYDSNLEKNQKKESIELSYSEGSKIADISNGAKKWRDSVLEKPIFVNYIRKEGKVEKSCSGQYAAMLKDNKYIVVDLGKLVGEEKCSG